MTTTLCLGASVAYAGDLQDDLRARRAAFLDALAPASVPRTIEEIEAFLARR